MELVSKMTALLAVSALLTQAQQQLTLFLQVAKLACPRAFVLTVVPTFVQSQQLSLPAKQAFVVRVLVLIGAAAVGK